MKRICLALLILALPFSSLAQETWLGLFLNQKKIGYSHNRISDDKLDGAAAKRSDTRTLINAGMMGTSMTMDLQQSVWTIDGKPKKMVFSMSSGGRVQTVEARFFEAEIKATVTNGGAKTDKTLPLPKDAKVVDDALTAMVAGGTPKGTQTFYVLDPMTVSLVKNTATMLGPATVKARGKTVKGIRIDISEVRATTSVYLTAKGDVIKAVGPMGIEMIPLTRQQALSPTGASSGPDLVDVSSLKADKAIVDPAGVRSLKLRITGRDLSRLPNDVHQTVTKTGSSWVVRVHPVRLSEVADKTIAAAAATKPAWVKATMNIPSDGKRFKALAKEIVGDETTVVGASGKILDYVNANMRFNGGIGVLRDAGEVLDSKEGVCRDYAVLTATLLRSAGIPARVAAGVVYAGERFYYHAWAEAWADGKWIGVDATRPSRQITATHVKLADGNVEEAFAFTFLGKAKIEVLNVSR